MTVAERMKKCRVIEKMKQNAEYAEKLGIQDISQYKKLDFINKEKEVGKC